MPWLQRRRRCGRWWTDETLALSAPFQLRCPTEVPAAAGAGAGVVLQLPGRWEAIVSETISVSHIFQQHSERSTSAYRWFREEVVTVCVSCERTEDVDLVSK